MLKHLLNDTAVLKSVQDVDEYDVPSVLEIKTIKCKIEFAAQADLSSLSSQKSLPARMYCIDNVSVGDIVSFDEINYKVLQVNSYNGFDGEITLREVFLI
jgi:hypothetical protein